MTILALPRTSTCTHCSHPIAEHATRNRGQIRTAWETVSGSTTCLAGDRLVHVPAGGGVS